VSIKGRSAELHKRKGGVTKKAGPALKDGIRAHGGQTGRKKRVQTRVNNLSLAVKEKAGGPKPRTAWKKKGH